jgi:fructose-1,6-bisphosphatase/inositol monophosphatase family enzyme
LTDVADLLAPIRELQEEVRRTVVDACERASPEELSAIAAEEEGDTIYAIDRVSDSTLVDFFAREVAPRASLVLVGEGIEGGHVVLPRGTREEDARWRVIVDPIDGTRALMYQKRSGWVLTGVAPNRGPATALSDIELAVQTEIPTVKQHL